MIDGYVFQYWALANARYAAGSVVRNLTAEDGGADYYGLSGWKRSLTIAGFTAGGAALGWFAGSMVEKFALAIAEKLGMISSAVSITAQKISEKMQPIIGNKLDYIFGKATGSVHNMQRSGEMLRKLQSIGIFDNDSGRKYVMQKIIEAFYHAQPITQENGRMVREFLLMGPSGD